jgi:hypothetical protein
MEVLMEKEFSDYDANIPAVADAARAMLAALKEVERHYYEADCDMVQAAITQAEAAGINAEG